MYVGELGSATRTRLFDPDPALPAAAAVTPAIYSPTGHLLYVRDRVLMARRFDLASLLRQRRARDGRADGGLRPARTGGVHGLGQHARVSREPASPARESGVGGSRGQADRCDRIAAWRVSHAHDRRRMRGRIAVDRRDAQGLPSVWLVDAARGTSSRLTATYWSGDPLWSPDGRTLAYSVAADSPPNLVVRGDGGQGPERRLRPAADRDAIRHEFYAGRQADRLLMRSPR